MRAKLIELTPERSTAWRRLLSWKAFLTMAWQSSNDPFTATQAMLVSVAVVMKRRCTSLMRPSGKSTTTLTFLAPRKASTAAPPVSPEVAQRIVWLRPCPPSRWS